MSNETLSIQYFQKAIAYSAYNNDIKPEHITRNVLLRFDNNENNVLELNFDDLDVIELIMQFEADLDIDIPDEENFNEFVTVGQMWDMLVKITGETPIEILP